MSTLLGSTSHVDSCCQLHPPSWPGTSPGRGTRPIKTTSPIPATCLRNSYYNYLLAFNSQVGSPSTPLTPALSVGGICLISTTSWSPVCQGSAPHPNQLLPFFLGRISQTNITNSINNLYQRKHPEPFLYVRLLESTISSKVLLQCLETLHSFNWTGTAPKIIFNHEHWIGQNWTLSYI